MRSSSQIPREAIAVAQAGAKVLLLEADLRRPKVAEYLDGENFVQHDPEIADGATAWGNALKHARNFGKQYNYDVRRVLGAGNFVLVQSKGDREGAELAMYDLFRVMNGKIVEHWDVIAAYEWPTVSGRSMVDGPTGIEDLDRTAANKHLVQGFVDDVLIGGSADKLTDYISTAQYHQHSTGVADGVDAFAEHLRQARHSGDAARYVKAHRLLGQGNFVVTFCEAVRAGATWAVFDLYRLKDGKIVDHWDVQEKVGPPDTWNNAGKF